MWDEITYPFPNFNGATVEVWEWITNLISHFMMGVISNSDLLSMLGFKLIHVGKRVPGINSILFGA